MTVRARSLAREAALKVLYQLDVRSDLDDADIDGLIQAADLGPPDARAFARELVAGVRANRQTIDAELEAVAINWKLERMAVIDRNVLRLGAFELLHQPDIPPAVSINEAVMLAKSYSTKDSGSFVNGILDKVHQRHGATAEAGE